MSLRNSRLGVETCVLLLKCTVTYTVKEFVSIRPSNDIILSDSHKKRHERGFSIELKCPCVLCDGVTQCPARVRAGTRRGSRALGRAGATGPMK